MKIVAVVGTKMFHAHDLLAFERVAEACKRLGDNVEMEVVYFGSEAQHTETLTLRELTTLARPPYLGPGHNILAGIQLAYELIEGSEKALLIILSHFNSRTRNESAALIAGHITPVALISWSDSLPVATNVDGFRDQILALDATHRVIIIQPDEEISLDALLSED